MIRINRQPHSNSFFRLTSSLSFEISDTLSRFSMLIETPDTQTDANGSTDDIATQLSSLLLLLKEVLSALFHSHNNSVPPSDLAGLAQLAQHSRTNSDRTNFGKMEMTNESLFLILLSTWERLLMISRPCRQTIIRMSEEYGRAVTSECPKWIEIFTSTLLQIVSVRCKERTVQIEKRVA